MERKTLVSLIHANRNGWMTEYAQTSHHIANAVVIGAITEAEILAYPEDEYPEDLSRNLAHKAGMAYWDDDDSPPDGVDELFSTAAEEIAISVQCLRGIVAGNADLDAGTWCFYTENLTEHQATLADIVEAMKTHTTITQAAQLILDADAEPSRTDS